MGTEYWLVDRESKSALDVGKFYRLLGDRSGYNEEETVTEQHCQTADGRPTIRSVGAATWIRDVASGRPVEMWSEHSEGDWSCYDPDNSCQVPRDGWTLYSVFDLSMPYDKHLRLWRPSEVQAIVDALPKENH